MDEWLQAADERIKIYRLIIYMKYAKYIFTIITMTLIGILYEKYKDTELSDEDARNYELVKKYLLNDSS